MKKAKVKVNASLLDGNVLLYGRERKNGRVTIWAIAAPDLKAEAATATGAEERFVKEVWDRFQLDEPFAIQYVDPGETSSADQTLFRVAPNEVTDLTGPARFFVNGFCSICQSGLGGRNEEPLELEHIAKKACSGLMVRFQPFFKCGMRVGMTLLHETICDAISRACKPSIEFRPVSLKSNKTTQFREVLSKSMIPYVVPLESTFKPGGICSKCGSIFIYANAAKGHSGVYLADSSAEQVRTDGVAMIGTASSPSICMSAAVWSKISKSAGAKGLVTMPVGELKIDKVNPKPKLEKIMAFKL